MSFFNFPSGFLGSPSRENAPGLPPLVRSPSSPFCTSPSQLQEVTLNQDDTMGFRSPGGSMRGRTVKEIEEQINSLKKENFNLKLRIYFLEEKLGTNFSLDKDNVLRKNIDLQVEIGNLQEKAKENHELLCQAVKALELSESNHKKYMKSKEEEIDRLHQEIDDIRSQLQEKTQNQLVNLIYDKTETFRHQIDSLQAECLNKEQTIMSLNEELNSAHARLIDSAQQMKEYEEKLAAQHVKNGELLSKMQEEQKSKEKLKVQLAQTSQKFQLTKFEIDQEREELQRNRKTIERNNMMLEMRVNALNDENRKQKEYIKEQQAKLEAAIVDAKKNQQLAVSNGPNDKSDASNIDDRFVSVPVAATSDRPAQENTLLVQVNADGVGAKMERKSTSKPQVPPTPDGKNLIKFEKLLDDIDSETIRSQFAILKNDYTAQKQKIIKLKGEQLKACEIIKNMIDFRNKTNQELTELKKAKEELEKELENVVTRPQREITPIQRRVSERNLTAVSTPPPYENDDQVEAATEMAKQRSICAESDLETMDQYKRLADQLEAKIEVLVETLKEKDSQMQFFRSQYNEILATLEEKHHRITDLEFELLSVNQNISKNDQSSLEKGDCGSEKQSSFYKKELEERDKEIERLNVELKKCNCYLQEIVNKELWEKNKEIENMHKKQEGNSEVTKLKRELSGKELQLKVLKEKIGELGLEIKVPSEDSGELKELMSPKRNIEHIKMLQDQLRSTKGEKKYLEDQLMLQKTSEGTIEKLKQENESIRHELEKSEQLRLETNEVCSVLSNRLEELAVFLDSLLKQKSVLGFLGSANNKKLREIINSSLDMSRSFSMSLMGNPEQSLVQLSNITTYLNGSIFQELSLMVDGDDVEEENSRLSIVPDNISLTYHSHLCKKTNGNQADNEQVIAALREQVFNLKSELQLRDNELIRLQQDDAKESGVEPLTDSVFETVNKKDLTITPKSSITLKALHSEVQSESEAWSEPDRVVSRARMGLNRSTPAVLSTQDQCDSTEDDEFYHNLTPSKRRSALVGLSKDIMRLQKEVDEKSEEILANTVEYELKLEELNKEVAQSREKLTQAISEKEGAVRKVEDLQTVIDELTSFRKHYEEAMVGKDKEMQEKINKMEVEKQKIISESQAYAQQVIDAKNQVISAQEKVRYLEDAMEKMEKEVKQECEAKLQRVEEEFGAKIRAIEEKCEAEVRIAQESLILIKEDYARDYIKKEEVEHKVIEAEIMLQELSNLKTLVNSYEETISSYKQKEMEFKAAISDHQNQLVTMAELLDNVHRENTELIEEKQNLQFQLDKILNKEQEVRLQLNDIQNNLTMVNEKLMQQVTELQKQKSQLELKISELENCNADLHNRLIKAQTSKFSLGLNATLPPNISTIKPAFGRQFSEQTYSSEDTADFKASHSNASLLPAVVDAERAQSNSSPDLGIESDHGRFSSLETNGNIPRPLLKTIELTESMNNLFEGQKLDNEVNASDHCCQKSVDIAVENTDLKRKLVRMKRALEETVTQLNLANQRKKQVEKTICKQIHKTSQVLRKAKANLDSGSEM